MEIYKCLLQLLLTITLPEVLIYVCVACMATIDVARAAVAKWKTFIVFF